MTTGDASPRRLLAVTALYAAVTAVMAYPFSLHPASTSLSRGPDGDLWLWTLGWDVHAFTHRPWAIFDANIFFPFRNTLAYSENLIGSAVLAAPIVWLGGSLVFALNLIELASIVLSAMGAYILGRRLGLSPSAAILCGLVFGFVPPRFLRIDQFHLTTIQWVPFGLAYLHAYFDTRRARDLRLALGLFSLQAVTSGHGGAFLALGMGLLVLWRLALGEPFAATTRLRDIGWSGGLLLLPAALVYLPYRAAQGEVGLRRGLDAWGLPASSFFTSGSHTQAWILAHAPRWDWLSGEPGAWLFPGLLPLVLAAAAVVGRRSGRSADSRRWWTRLAVTSEIASVVFLGIAVWAMAYGRVRFEIGGIRIFTAQGWRAWLPCVAAVAVRTWLGRQRAPLMLGATIRWRVEQVQAWRRSGSDGHAVGFYVFVGAICLWLAVGPPFGLWQWVYGWPGLSLVRGPSRFVLLGMLALAVLAGFGFDRVASRVRIARGLLAAVVGLAFLAESAAMPLVGESYAIEQPAIERWIATQPGPFSFVEMPVPDSLSEITRAVWNTRYMLHSTAHWQPIWQGYSGIEPPGYGDVRSTLTRFPDAESVGTLRRLGVTHVILHMDLIPPEERRDADARLAEAADEVRLEHVEGEGRLYSIRPR